MDKELFADVILPLAVPHLFTYSVPQNLRNSITPGQRVVVQFGAKKLYTALVESVHYNKPEQYKAKPIESILDQAPLVNALQLQFWKWMSDYYLCHPGDVMNAALPSGLKLSSETRIMLHPGQEFSEKDLSNDEYLLWEALNTKPVISLKEAEEILGRRFHSIIRGMMEKNWLLVYEELQEKFKPKKEDFIRLHPKNNDDKKLRKVFDELEKKAFKQLEVLTAFIHLSSGKKEVKKTDLLNKTGASPSVIESLEKKNILEVYTKETGRFQSNETPAAIKELTPEQEKAYASIRAQWKSKEIVLFHGVTSSGKTEIYIRLIKEAMDRGEQVLYLLPEIALTTQVVSRIRKYFGQALGVYHSKFNENERVEIWNGVNQFKGKDSKFQVILGARSAMFLPFSKLGLVIVDEEHDSSYKQFDPAPRYHARDSAMVLAHMHKAKVLLGSATPSIESLHNASSGKFGKTELLTRFGGIEMPEILVADIKDATRRKKMQSHFSPLLMDHIKAALSQQEQVIIFQNRRGFAPYLECKTCGWSPECKNCDVSLVYHKAGNLLRCHYCGFATTVPPACAACGAAEIQMKNFGTEKIEEELQHFFPDARIARMDYDSTRSKHSHQRIIQDFEEHRTDILVGTQMVTKGLDFANVSTVGILSADQALNFPDFRSHERCFQLLMQVAGRAGRQGKRGKVIIQTYSPANPVIQQVINNDHASMYKEEIGHRELFHYPPFYRLIGISVMDQDPAKLNDAAAHLGRKLREHFGDRVLGPEFALVPRVKNLYQKKFLLKFSKDESVSKAKEMIRQKMTELNNDPNFRSVRVHADVDPA